MFHWVEGAHALGTLQLGQPAWIAERTGAPVVSDVRIRDITVGGHGAPLVSILDIAAAGRRCPACPAALNLGGISNMTVLERPDAARSAYDIGPANALLDAVVRRRPRRPRRLRRRRQIAARGTVDEALLAVLLDEPYYALPTPKSTGKELFHLEYVRAAIERAGDSPPTPDLLATLTELTARDGGRRRAGRGLRPRRRLRRRLPQPVPARTARRGAARTSRS